MIREVLLAEFDHELAVTRRLLERCPSDFAWAPHPRSFTLGRLATHLARLPHWGEWILNGESYDLVLDSTPAAEPCASVAEVLGLLDGNVTAVRALLVGKSDAELAAPWTLRRNGEVLMTLPRLSALKLFIVNHGIHHRGQLSVYLRLLNVPVPAIYGPSADEGA